MNLLTVMAISSNNLYCMERSRKMNENKNPWVVVEAGDGFICARNGKDNVPETGNHYYVEWQDAQQEADWNNEAEGITDAPRFDDDF